MSLNLTSPDQQLKTMIGSRCLPSTRDRQTLMNLCTPSLASPTDLRYSQHMKEYSGGSSTLHLMSLKDSHWLSGSPHTAWIGQGALAALELPVQPSTTIRRRQANPHLPGLKDHQSSRSLRMVCLQGPPAVLESPNQQSIIIPPWQADPHLPGLKDLQSTGRQPGLHIICL